MSAVRAKRTTKKATTRKRRLKLVDDIVPPKYNRIMGIDASTRGVAATLIVNGKIQTVVKITLTDSDLHARLLKVRKWFTAVLKMFAPEFAVIEQPIYIQNPTSTRAIGYVVGIVLGEILINEIPVIDVPPITWKAALGYKNVTKKLQRELIEKLGETEGNKEVRRLRKAQVQDILSARFPAWDWTDDDRADSCGIALYGWNLRGRYVRD